MFYDFLYEIQNSSDAICSCYLSKVFFMRVVKCFFRTFFHYSIRLICLKKQFKSEWMHFASPLRVTFKKNNKVEKLITLYAAENKTNPNGKRINRAKVQRKKKNFFLWSLHLVTTFLLFLIESDVTKNYTRVVWICLAQYYIMSSK